MFFFFFKQKTAYDMRISDWSSDVCSSDLIKRARLIAYVTANFQPPVANPTLLSTWIAFWSLIKTDPVIAAIHSESYAAFRSDLESLLTDCGMIPARAGPAAIALTAMIDGLWLELSLDSSAFTPQEAGAMAMRWADTLLEQPEC